VVRETLFRERATKHIIRIMAAKALRVVFWQRRLAMKFMEMPSF
jgi:hypothetical protein